MALNTTPEQSSGILNAIKGALGLQSDVNKYGTPVDGQNPIQIDEYESTLDPIEIMELIAQWKRTYSAYYTDIERGQKLSFDYWVGKQKNEDSSGADTKGSIDNLIFEAVETFLPIATRANPEPLVQADPSDIGQSIAKDIKVALTNWADNQKLRRKLAKMTRGWLLNRIGVAKMSWNPLTKVIELSIVNAKRMIWDKDGYIDEGGHFVGEYTGEKKSVTAKKLAELFPKKRADIIKKSGGKMGTKLEYYEWWYLNKDIIFTLDEVLLGKYKNPNWNYDVSPIEAVPPVIDPETQAILEQGKEAQDGIQGTNHLKEMSSPYRFLAIFSTAEQPHDNTSLILQNIPQQDKINRRERQIEMNVKKMNNGMVVSGKSFTEEQASQAASALARGIAIRVPDGEVGKAVVFPTINSLPPDVFKSLEDGRAELRNIFGTAGSTAQGVESQETVRGKILVNQMDSSRIGGGITEYIEQVADSLYNLAVQFMFVYYDEEHFITTAGSVAGMELITLKNDRFPLLRTLDITVKEGSLVPKDPLTQRNEALEMWGQGVIDPVSLYKKLDWPNPQEAAEQLILWQLLQKGAIQPQQYLPTFGQGQQQQTPMPPPPGVGGPAFSPPSNAGVNNPQPAQPSIPEQSQQLIQSVPIK